MPSISTILLGLELPFSLTLRAMLQLRSQGTIEAYSPIYNSISRPRSYPFYIEPYFVR